jgi:hypothetical protein
VSRSRGAVQHSTVAAIDEAVDPRRGIGDAGQPVEHVVGVGRHIVIGIGRCGGLAGQRIGRAGDGSM